MGLGLAPCEGSATELLVGFEGDIVGVNVGDFLDSLDDLVGGQVNDFNAFLGTDDQPEQLLGEEDDVNGGFDVVLGEPLALNEVPDHNGAVTGA